MMLVWFPIITILVIAAQSLVIFYLLKVKNQTDYLLATFCGLMLMDSGLMLFVNLASLEYAYWSTAAPFGLIYGPILFLLYNSVQKPRVQSKAALLHFLPALVGLIFYIVTLSSFEFRKSFLRQFQILLYMSMCASWIIYPCLIIAHKNRTALLGFGLFKYGMILLWVLTSYLIPLIWSSLESGIKETALTEDFVVIGTMLVAIVLAYWNFLKKFRHVARLEGKVYQGGLRLDAPSEEVENKTVGISTTSPNQLKNIPEEYKEKIIQSILLERYCDPSFNLQQMAKEFGLLPALASQYFSQVYPEGFVKTINKKRIEKACYFLQQEDMKINMEELAFLCGFNSRASFYRNFQSEMSCSPSAYRESLL